MLLMIDNYDSFTYNIVQIVDKYIPTKVVRPDEVTLEEVMALKPARIILSPGPSSPDPNGLCAQLVRHASVPLLGVCLGHQTIIAALGGQVVPSGNVFHGKSSVITHDSSHLFRNIPQHIRVARYHSLIGLRPLPAELRITAQTEDGTIMAVEHVSRPLYGIQFHPESILCQHGEDILCNFLEVPRQQGRDHHISVAV
ncbi:aminodeoxychorismate/anthranilate synthase component II [Desulfurispirillum indicum]|uniref:Glutamine amidotransferase of anthranilate synthase n=1 Tax=Desulfurispirillum indicum (strain ATCC BAA-1389 / DSM 22839 / S5) TaxID=653733 RepID=E6W0G2_DESIS|nr:aminodeoxychorismate/anthranilate synthase component II [Desulfurispirillum indicum]ADU66380.1 glutamine amidotransferase of anthranilate synthase [Desulfurispirillum indicum S5]UCZ55713.1 aminodeoxychorismate/anthranilate synthase component II [Desulfurispirillum indicum]